LKAFAAPLQIPEMPEDTRSIALSFDDSDEYRPEAPLPPEIPLWKDGSTRIGIHTSIAGDLSNSLEIAQGLGANALQIFSSSPRMWDRGISRIAEADAARFRDRRKELGLGPLVIHCNYLVNLASPNPVLRARSVQGFHGELVRAIALGADFLVIHPGSHKDTTPEAAISSIAQGIRQAARGLKLGDLVILFENTAGHGNSIGAKFEELRAIRDLLRDIPTGICIDTAHTFAAGWDIRTEEGLEAALQHIELTVGLKCVHVVHTNDSKTHHGSRVDRHDHIGKGKIGLEAFGRILNHPLLAGRAFILETPIDSPGDDKRNVAALWKLLGREVKATHPGMKPRPHKTTAKSASRSTKKAVTKRAAKKKPARKKSPAKKSKPRKRGK
jgi:deoxyribonuclease-4